MAKEILISTTPHETRLAIVEDDQLAEIYYERENEYTLAGSIYKGRVTRVLPGMQSSFVDVGLERDAFLYVTDFLEDSEDSEEYETSAAPGSRRASLPAPAEEAPLEGAERAERSERGERGGRRDGRRGDRNRAERPAPTVETAPVEATSASSVPSTSPGTSPTEPNRRQRIAEERAQATAALRTAQPASPDLEEKGDDETPDGTRRWRGRRGRRRGGMRAGVLGEMPKTAPGAAVSAAAEAFDIPEHGAPGGTIPSTAEFPFDPAFEGDDEPESLNLHAAAAQVEAAPAEAERSGRPRQPRAERAARPERDRTERSSMPVADARVTGAVASAAIFLPGESLSKYGAKPETLDAAKDATGAAKAEAKLTLPQRPVNYTPPRPASLVDSVSGWDGGAVLPGETLSRHKPSAAPATQAAASPQRSESHLEIPVEPSIVEATPMPVEGEPVPLEAPAQADPVVAQWQPGQSENLEQDGSEFEPTEGSASVRVPPVRSELRFSQLFGGRSEPAPEPAHDVTAEPARNAAHAPEAAASSAPLRSTLQAGTENTMAAPQHERNDSPETQEFAAPALAPDHEHDQPDKAHDQHDQAHDHDAELEASVHLSAIHAEHKEDNFTELVDQLQGFAPGAGLLEEEVIDEDEYDFDPIHAHGDDHDLEEIEEETLDGLHEDGPLEYAAAEEAVEVQPAEITSSRGRGRGRGRNRDREKAPRTPLSQVPQSAAREEVDEEEVFQPFALEPMDLDEEADSEQDEGGVPGSTPGADAPHRDRSGADAGRRNGRNGGRRRGMTGGGGSRRSAQTQDLPVISDLLKPGQEILVQIAKEPIAKKGARITSHIALPGRFLVFMPTVSHVGVSRKIASDEERQRLKRILISEKGESAGGFIVRTAAEGASEEELRADLRFLISLWTEIKQRADTAKAPALIYHDLNLVERILRDQVSSNFSTIWVDTEQEYERIVRFLNRFQPALVRRVKLYTKETPLFEHFGIQEEISKALKAKVWLKSGGSIVINQTEALVAIDINTGKYVGKTARLEDTIVKTNLDAIPEIVRQIRLRDLGGIIIIDFIDMDERKNRHRVLAALEEAMKVDRAPSKVLQFNDFGLVAITRKRVKQSLERTLSVQCDVCSGTGMVKSPITVCNEIFIEMRKMQKHLDGKDVMLRVHPEVVKQLKGGNGRWINEYEEMVGKTIIIKSDPSLHPEQFDIH